METADSVPTLGDVLSGSPAVYIPYLSIICDAQVRHLFRNIIDIPADVRIYDR